MGRALIHHGILGMKWGVRRYQNEDGSLTPEGKRRQKQLQNQLEKGEIKREQLESELRSTNKDNWNKAINGASKAIDASEYAARYRNAFNTSAALDAEANSINASLGFGAVPIGRGAAEVAIREKEYKQYAEKYINDHYDDFAAAALLDLGYDNTKAGREYLRKISLLDWKV